MLKRKLSKFLPYDGPAPEETLQLENEGHCLLRGVFKGESLHALREEIVAIYDGARGELRAGIRDDEAASMFRYQMFNRSALCQTAMGHPRILDVIYPLLGHDCHAINSTAWRNPPGIVEDPEKFYFWHIDAGPHVPRPAEIPWPSNIPYPIFVIGSHIYLEDCNLDDGPTTIIPTSHRSGQQPPYTPSFDENPRYQGHEPVSQIAKAGDVGFFVSDVWHRRRLPTERSTGRFFLQTNYARRDIAQRILPCDLVNHVSEEARARAKTKRERQLIGLHEAAYYDG